MLSFISLGCELFFIDYEGYNSQKLIVFLKDGNFFRFPFFWSAKSSYSSLSFYNNVRLPSFFLFANIGSNSAGFFTGDYINKGLSLLL